MTLWACFGAIPAYFRVGGGTGYALEALSHLLSIPMGLFSVPLRIFALLNCVTCGAPGLG